MYKCVEYNHESRSHFLLQKMKQIKKLLLSFIHRIYENVETVSSQRFLPHCCNFEGNIAIRGSERFAINSWKCWYIKLFYVVV